MRIAFFTPFDRDSAVGNCSRLILPALSRRHDVEIWCPAAANLMGAPAPVIPFEPLGALGDPRLDRYDLLLFQLGNDPKRFEGILEMCRHCPGVHILSDYVLHGAVARYHLDKLRAPAGYIQAVERAYGAGARHLAEDSVLGLHTPLWESGLAGTYPLFTPVLERSLGVAVSSKFHLDVVRRVFPGPSECVSFPASPIASEPVLSKAGLEVPSGRTIMLSTGYVNRTKLHGVVIEALRRSPELAKQVLFVIAGQACPEEFRRLQSMAREYRLDNSVRFTGFLSDDLLHAWLLHADFCVNLRWPNTEGASGSLVQQMLHGKATVVLPSGFYGEMPEETVVRIEAENLDQIHEPLFRLATDHGWRERVGRAAKSYAEATFDPCACGERLAAFLEAAVRVRATR